MTNDPAARLRDEIHDKLRARSDAGLNTYGKPINAVADHRDWLQMAEEELLDGLVYIEAARIKRKNQVRGYLITIGEQAHRIRELEGGGGDLPTRVKAWLVKAFGEAVALDKSQRNHRFLEEALELVQSLGCTREECHALVDYVYGRPIGEPFQEAGGALLTLAGLCAANDIPMAKAGDTELARVWSKIDLIRLKQASKPTGSPLPGSVELVSPSEGGKAEKDAG